MGYYDKGTYGQGSYNPDLERQSARDRYLDLLAKERMGTQTMTDKMRREQDEQRAQMEEDAAGSAAVKDAQLGMAAGGPWGALIGGLIGKGMGSFEYGQKRGSVLAGLKKFVDPRGEFHALTGTNGQSGAAGASLANQAGDYREERRKRMLEDKLRADKERESTPGFDNSAYPAGSDSSLNSELAKSAAQPSDYPAMEQSSYESASAPMLANEDPRRRRY